ncbi:MAG: ABC transporter permease [Desulfatiglandales bacterium]
MEVTLLKGIFGSRKAVSALSLLALLSFWEVGSKTGILSPVFLPAPSGVILVLLDMIGSGELWPHLFFSLKRIFWGMLIGVGLGWIVGMATGLSPLIGAVLNPILACLYPIPKVAILPLLILYLGIGEASKVGVISIGVFFPVFINTRSGVKGVDSLWILAARSLGASTMSIWLKVVLPASLPYSLSGVRLGSGIALLLLVTSEMIGANSGIGYLILSSADLMLTDRLLAGILITSLLGLFFSYAVDLLEKRLLFN